MDLEIEIVQQFYKNISSRPVLIWGASIRGQVVYEYLKEANIPVAGFVDNNSAKWDKTFLNLPIYKPESIRKGSKIKNGNIYPPPLGQLQ